MSVFLPHRLHPRAVATPLFLLRSLRSLRLTSSLSQKNLRQSPAKRAPSGLLIPCNRLRTHRTRRHRPQPHNNLPPSKSRHRHHLPRASLPRPPDLVRHMDQRHHPLSRRHAIQHRSNGNQLNPHHPFRFHARNHHKALSAQCQNCCAAPFHSGRRGRDSHSANPTTK